MRSRWTIIWGGTLLLLGALLFAQQIGLFGRMRLSLAVLMLGLPALMFLLTFALDRRQWWALIPGIALLTLTAVAFNGLSPYSISVVSGAIFLLTLGVSFWSLFIVKRKLWWALIVSAVVTVLAVVAILASGSAPGRVVGAFLFSLLGSIRLSFVIFLFGIPALMFLLVFILDRQQWWSLIPSSVLLGLTWVLLNELNHFSTPLTAAAIFLFSIGLPFWLIYLIKRWWWTLIPAGVMTVIALIPILIDYNFDGLIIGSIVCFGFSTVFLLIRLVNRSIPEFRWTWWPISIFAGLGLVLLLLGTTSIVQYMIPIVLMIIGGGLLLRNFMKPRSVQ
jgi:hypothetical protein